MASLLPARSSNLFVPLVAIIATVSQTCTANDVTDLAQYGMNISVLDGIFSSESSEDYGPNLTSDQSDALWQNGTEFEWELSTTSLLPSETLLYPYVICSIEGGLSGNQRIENLKAAFQAANVTNVDAITDIDRIYNAADRTCLLARAESSDLMKVYETTPETKQYMQTQPAMSSMKLLKGTVDKIAQKLATPLNIGDNVIEIMSLEMTFCPFDVPLPDTAIQYSIKNFITEDEGKTVSKASFFAQIGGDNGTLSERMNFWYEQISTVVENTTTSTGGKEENYCIDFIDENIYFFNTTTLTMRVNLRHARDENPEDINTCVWYLVQSIALHPYVCRVEAVSSVGYNPPAPTPTPTSGAPLSSRSIWGVCFVAVSVILTTTGGCLL